MNIRIMCIALLLCSFAAVPAKAGFFLNVGSHTLSPNTANQAIDLFLTSTSNADLAVAGMNFRAKLGDGSGSQGIFQGTEGTRQGIQVTGGGYFWDELGTGVVGETPVIGFPAFADMSVTFDTNLSTAIGNGNTVRIATIRIDATGLMSGTYAIDLMDDVAGSIQLLLFDPNPSPNGTIIARSAGDPNFTVTNGSFTITAVPEPSALLLLAFVAVLVAGHRLTYKETPRSVTRCPTPSAMHDTHSRT